MSQEPSPVVVNQTRAHATLADLWSKPAYARFAAAALARRWARARLLGDPAETDYLAGPLREASVAIEAQPWEFGLETPAPPADEVIVVCKLPVMPEHWSHLQGLQQQYAGHVRSLHELALPVTALDFCLKLVPIFGSPESSRLDQACDWYTGRRLYWTFDALDAAFPLRGRRVIEFGPLDGFQTAGLVKLGAAEVTCIEARAENVLKVVVAKEVLGWSGVRVVIDDFHNVRAANYGRFDLVVAHGVYYHSIAPFVFLENVCSLSDTVFVGGYCATDALPPSPSEQLTHGGRSYLAKRYQEVEHFMAGINPWGFFLYRDDLLRFFHERGFSTRILSDEETSVSAGRYIRFLATRR
jgi:hypothetical protein